MVLLVSIYPEFDSTFLLSSSLVVRCRFRYGLVCRLWPLLSLESNKSSSGGERHLVRLCYMLVLPFRPGGDDLMHVCGLTHALLCFVLVLM